MARFFTAKGKQSGQDFLNFAVGAGFQSDMGAARIHFWRNSAFDFSLGMEW